MFQCYHSWWTHAKKCCHIKNCIKNSKTVLDIIQLKKSWKEKKQYQLCHLCYLKLSEGGGNVLSSSVNCCRKFASRVLKDTASNSEKNLLKLNKTCFDSINMLNDHVQLLSLCSDLKTQELCQEKKVYLHNMVYRNKNTYYSAQGITLSMVSKRNILSVNSVCQW